MDWEEFKKMKKTFTIIYSILVSLVLIFSITFFAVNIYNENAHGELRTQLRFEKILTGVKSAFEKNNISSSEKLRQIENTIGDTSDFDFIKITADGSTIYLYPEDFNGFEESSSNLILIYKRTINTNGSKINISSGMYSLRPSSIFKYAKISFLIILIVALLTVIMIIYNNHFNKNSKSYTPKKSKQKIVFDDQSDSDQEEEEIDQDEELIDYEEDDIENEEYKEEELEEAPLQKEEPHYAPAAAKIEELPVEDYEPVEIENNSASGEKGLFSPDTGLGWESYLMTRLENELNRATASELDLALFIIKIQGLGRKNPVMKKICEYLTVEFQFKDLLFEYGSDSICGIKISMDIDNAIQFAEKIVNEIKNIAIEENPIVLAGVTSRSIRMVSGERLLKEASEAVKHAADDIKNPVVGFRADAVKYRKFLEKN